MPFAPRSIVGLSLFLALPGLAWADAKADLVAGGTPPKMAARIERHVAFGLPSRATRTNDNDFLLPRNGAVISYNASRNAMNWASWSVSKSDLGASKRNEDFKPDGSLPSRFYKPNSGDYKMPGYSRGHMVRSGERTASARENKKTFVFSNMLPQAVNNNTGPWNMFEDFYRDEVSAGNKTAHVIAGGVFGKAPTAELNVKVPSATWKVVALTEAGQQTDQITDKTRVVAIVIPNENSTVKVEQGWGQYRTSVADIERQTGLTFFKELPAALATKIKNQVDNGPVPARLAAKWQPRNWNESMAPKNIVSRQVTGTVKWYDSDKKYGFITMPDGSDVFVSANNRATSIAKGETVTFDVGQGKDGRNFALAVKSHDPKAMPVEQAGYRAAPGTRGYTAPPERTMVAKQVSGTVKWFNEELGYGFVTGPDGKDVMVHASRRATEIKTGDRVVYDIALNTNGKEIAMDVKSMDRKAGPPKAFAKATH